MENKKLMAFRASQDTREKINLLAQELDLSQADVIAMAIRNLSKLKTVGAEMSETRYNAMKAIADAEGVTVPEVMRDALYTYLKHTGFLML